MSNVLSAVSPDHQVVHDTIKSGADGDKFLRNITHHYWKDNGQGVGSLFSWTGDPAVVQGPEERIAAETAHVYSSYIGGHQQELLHLPGNHTLGQVNPNLVRDMAHGLGPYANNIAGTSGGLPGFGDPLDGHTMSGALPVAKGVFLAELHSIRDGYSNSLRTAEKNLAVDGYDPSRIWGVDNHEPETPDQAEQDVHDALAGDQGAAGRVNAVLGSITPDQLAGKVPLTAEQASVLSQLQAQEHGMSVDALTTAEQRLGAQRGMIANSWQLMSNPNISFPKTQLTVGAKQGSDTVKGGISQLPASVQQALNSPNAIFMHQMNDIAGIVKDGDRGFQTNTELDRAMIHKASVMMDTPIWHIDPASRGQNVERDPALDPTVSNVLSAVSPDHQVVHDTI
ncbi:hypothetical protein B1T50_01780, partial [Mycobacterium kansasii]